MEVVAREVVGYAWKCPWCGTENVTEKDKWCICTECEELVVISKIIN